VAITRRLPGGPGALIAAGAGILAGLLAIAGAEANDVRVPLIIVSGFGVMALALLRTDLAIYLAVLLLPLEALTAQTAGGVGITPTEVVVVAAAVGWLIRTMSKGGEIPRSRVIPPLVALIAIHIPTVFLAANGFAVFKQMFMWSAMTILVIAVLADRRPQTTERLAGAIAAAGALVAAVAIYKSVGTNQLVTEFGGIVTNRATGPFASPVLLGTFVLIGIPLQVVFAIRGRTSLIRLGGMAAVTLSVLALLLALSRSATVALVAAMAWIVIWWRPARKPALAVVLIFTALLLTRFNPAPDVFNPQVVGERLSSITTPDTRTAQLRFRIWRKSPEIFWDNFPFGIGPKNLPERAEEYDLTFQVGAPSNAHNTLLVIATELGLPGLLVMGWFAFAMLLVLLRGIREAIGMDRMFAIAVSGMFVSLLADSITGYSFGANAFSVVVFLQIAIAARVERGINAQRRPPEPAARPDVPTRPKPEPEPALA
jgi:O-antigen ligase